MVRAAGLVALAVLLAGCGSRSHGRYAYDYVPGKTATLQGGYAVAPAGAPQTIKTAIEAGNRIAGLPYRYGAGHTHGISNAYDCSGAASFVLCQAGLLGSPTTSNHRTCSRVGASACNSSASIAAASCGFNR